MNRVHVPPKELRRARGSDATSGNSRWSSQSHILFSAQTPHPLRTGGSRRLRRVWPRGVGCVGRTNRKRSNSVFFDSDRTLLDSRLVPKLVKIYCQAASRHPRCWRGRPSQLPAGPAPYLTGRTDKFSRISTPASFQRIPSRRNTNSRAPGSPSDDSIAARTLDRPSHDRR